MDFSVLVDYTPYILIGGGVVAISWFLEKLVRPVPVVGKPASILTKILSFFGFFVGILLIVTGAAALSTQGQVDNYTQYLLLVAGLALFLRPIKDIPWAALLGLIVGGLSAGIVYFFFPLPETVVGISSTWVYLAIFLVPAVIVYMVFKFIEDLLKLIGMILGSKPVTLIVGIVCIVQGVLLLLDMNLFSILSA
ncbi:MAG: hypothetical protein JSW14_07690 [Candidatus Bathyarchaeum sp.]|nr:MAG: hypothetical protein JSW14_07690 [Candidatus Bathyarchaeum sp.]